MAAASLFCAAALQLLSQRTIGKPAIVQEGVVPALVTLLRESKDTTTLRHGLAANLAGGTHHAHRTFGSGFTILNDLAIAAEWARAHAGVKRVAIVDLDVHQGDGTAALFADNPDVYTFSMHCGANFPFRKAVSDCDVDVPRGTGDAEYDDVDGTGGGANGDDGDEAADERADYDGGDGDGAGDEYADDVAGDVGCDYCDSVCDADGCERARLA